MTRYKVVLFRDKSEEKEYRFRIVASNGRIVSQSEGYGRKRDRDTTVGNLIDYLRNAEIVSHDVPNDVHAVSKELR